MTQKHTPLLLSVAIGGFGYHPAAPHTQPARLVDLAYYRRLAERAEQGRLDLVLLDDARSLAADHPFARLDALSVLAAVAPHTRFVGLAVSKPTTYSEPFTVSRELATLDWLSGGRAAWHVTTTALDVEAQNFGQRQALPAPERRAIAEEFVAVSRKLWDSWEDDAVIVDRERGLYLDPHKLHHIDHVGDHFRIRGPQITYRPPQGHVVVIQIDDGDPGALPSAALADLLVLHNATLPDAQHAYARVRQQAADAGRELRVLQSILPILGQSEAQAQRRAADLDAALSDGHAAPRATRLVGTPAQVADSLEEWFRASAADGFHLLPAVLPDGLDEIVDQLVPELQQRGLLRNASTGTTLRERLGLLRPASQYAGAPSEAHTAYE